MSAREAKLIDELRNKELKALTDAEFKAVKAEVESKGIRNLKGSAAQIVFAALRKRDEAMKKATVEKHGNHDQSQHGAWANGKYNTDDSEGEDYSEPKNYKGKKPKITWDSTDDSEGEYGDSNYDDPKWMDDMDILRPPKRSPKK